jgi:hypothetical protein
LETGTPLACHRSISIVADGRLDVCDGAHWAFVMKNNSKAPLNGAERFWPAIAMEAASRKAREVVHPSCFGSTFKDKPALDPR